MSATSIAHSNSIMCKADPEKPVSPGGVSHFGFAIGNEDLGEAVAQVVQAGGKLLRRGKHGGRSDSDRPPIPPGTQSRGQLMRHSGLAGIGSPDLPHLRPTPAAFMTN